MTGSITSAVVWRFMAAMVLVAAGAASHSASETAAEAPRVVRSGVAHDLIFDMAFNGRKGVAVGAFGTVLLSQDSGANWRETTVPGERMALLGVAINDAGCIAVGQLGKILVSDDCQRWRTITPVNPSRLMAVGLNRSGLSYAVGAFATVLRSNDGGQSWEAVTLDWDAITEGGPEPHLYDVAVDEDGAVTIVGEFGLILHSSDGTDWQVKHRGEKSLFGLSVAAGRAYAVGQAGIVLHSADGGSSWVELETDSRAIFTGVWTGGDGRVVISGINALLHSLDGGQNWQISSSKLVKRASHLAIAAVEREAETNHVLIAGSGARILEFALDHGRK